MKIYRVGGAVRDKLLGRPPQDSDWVVVGATADDLLRLGYIAVGKDFPVFLHSETREEYALARTERKSGPGYKGFQVHAHPLVTLEDDLRRRDLTINAMAEDEAGQITDPYGGMEDLRNKVLRHVSPAFTEDPVRILRVARFATRFAPLGFTIADETLELMRSMVQTGEVNALVPERVWQEMARALAEFSPSTFFLTLRRCGALQVLLPEIDRLFGVPQRAEFHPEIDTGVHTMLVVDRARQLTDDTRVVFAALVHDLGKGTTPPEVLPRHIGHEVRSVSLTEALCQRFRIPNDYRDLAKLVARYHGDCHRAAELRPDTILKLLEKLDVFRRPERLSQFLLACQADAQGRTGREQQPYPQATRITHALRAAQTVSTDSLLEQGLSGVALGQALRERRLHAIKLALHDQPV